MSEKVEQQDSPEDVRSYLESRYQIIKRKAEQIAGKAQNAMFGDCDFDERYQDD